MSRLINLTPHPVTLRGIGGDDTVVPVAGEAARVEQHPGQRLVGYWTRHEKSGPNDTDGPVPVYGPSRYGAIQGLPGSVEAGDVLIVSLIVLQAAAAKIRGLEELQLWSRSDPAQYHWSENEEQHLAVLRSCVAPGTGPADEPVRDAQGRILAVTRLISV